jgi:hypothetical protein
MVNYFTENGEIRSALNQNVAERTDKLILLIVELYSIFEELASDLELHSRESLLDNNELKKFLMMFLELTFLFFFCGKIPKNQIMEIRVKFYVTIKR